MSTHKRKLTKEEISNAFAPDALEVGRPTLTTKEAAELLRVSPKTINSWKNAGYLEGTYRKHQGKDCYWRDRLLDCYFNGADWHEKK